MAIKPIDLTAKREYVHETDLLPRKRGQAEEDRARKPDASVFRVRMLTSAERDHIADDTSFIANGRMGLKQGTARNLRVKFALESVTNFPGWDVEDHPLGIDKVRVPTDEFLDTLPDDVKVGISTLVSEMVTLDEDEVGKSESSVPSSGTKGSQEEAPADPAESTTSGTAASGDA